MRVFIFIITEYGPALIEHVLLKHGFNNSAKIGKTFDIEKDINCLMDALTEANNLFQTGKYNHQLVRFVVCIHSNYYYVF